MVIIPLTAYLTRMFGTRPVYVVAAGAFIVTSITLTIIAAQNSAGTSILDRLAPAGRSTQEEPATAPGGDINTDDLLAPPSSGGNTDAPLVPSAD